MENFLDEREKQRRMANRRRLKKRAEKLRKIKIYTCMGAVGVIGITLIAWCVIGNNSDDEKKTGGNNTVMVGADATLNSYNEVENTEKDTEKDTEETTEKKYGYGDEVYSDGKFVVCIDPGHGGNDVGCEGIDGSYESEDDLALALLVKQHLEEANVKVIMTRSVDEWVDLADRPYIANKSNADLLVSIHRNSNEEGAVNGVEAWISGKENDNSYEIAKLIMNNLDRVGISRNRGVRSGSMTSEDKDYVVNGKSCMPSVLLEMGFMSSPTDNRLFKQNLEGYAKAIAEAVLQWSETQPY